MVAGAAELMALPADFSDVAGVLLACQMGTAYSPLDAMKVGRRDTLVVSGLGGVGLCAVMLGRAMGAEVIGIDPSAGRRALAEALGASATVDPGAAKIMKAVRSLSQGGATKLVETSGAAAAHLAIPRLLQPEGVAAIVGRGTNTLTLKLSPLISDQIHVFGSNLYPKRAFSEIVEFVRAQRLQIERVATHVLGLEDAPMAFRLADQGHGGKVIIAIDGHA
jgi:D-arabinose 1-dehydrogenase-like Zn-dependent alcohol dehydrogenase